MKSKYKNFVVVYSADGLEKDVSYESAQSVLPVLIHLGTTTLLPINKSNWIEQLSNIRKDELAVLATHGGMGEDGTIQSYLESKGLAHTHSNHLACSVLSHKHLTKLIYIALGIHTPFWQYDSIKYGIKNKERTFIKKPVLGGSKIGIKLWHYKLPAEDKKSIYEQIVRGNLEISVSVIGNKKNIVLPPIIRKRNLLDIGVLKKTSIVLSNTVFKYCQKQARYIHETLDCRGITKTDFVIDDHGVPFAIETDAHPGLGKTRSSAQAAQKAGLDYNTFISLIVKEV